MSKNERWPHPSVLGTPAADMAQQALSPTGSILADPVQARRVAEVQRRWAEHVARVKKIDAKIDRLMAPGGS